MLHAPTASLCPAGVCQDSVRRDRLVSQTMMHMAMAEWRRGTGHAVVHPCIPSWRCRCSRHVTTAGAPPAPLQSCTPVNTPPQHQRGAQCRPLPPQLPGRGLGQGAPRLLAVQASRWHRSLPGVASQSIGQHLGPFAVHHSSPTGHQLQHRSWFAPCGMEAHLKCCPACSACEHL